MITEAEIKKPELIGPNRFTFNGNIIAELGKESISNPNIAIAELIKNAYDADSKNVSIMFYDIEKHNTRIVIADDGIGMDATQIKDRWMDVGSPHKKSITRTEGLKRVPVGAKGVGRFASHCLANTLKLITASKNDNFGYRLTFNWRTFTSLNKATDIDIPTERFRKKKESSTVLVLENLQEQWNDEQKLKFLLKDLYLLTSPVDPPRNFRIKPSIADDAGALKKINKTFLDKAGYRLRVQLSKQKQLSFEFYKNGVLTKNGKEELDRPLCCGDATLDLYFYYRAADRWKQWLDKDISKKDLDDIRTTLDEYGGIKLYRDHFRVKPYGDNDADWIGLNDWSRDQSIVPGNGQIFAVVSISRESNPSIEDTTSREGVFNNKEYFDLVTFVTTSIDLFVKRRSEVETSKAKARKTNNGVTRRRVKITPVMPKVVESQKAVSTPLIDIKGDYPQIFYHKLEDEINGCYNAGYPNAVFFLCRKMVENLMYDILVKKFPGKKELWWAKDNYHLNLSPLLKNLRDNKDAFEPNIKALIEKAYVLGKPFRDETNNTSHNIYDYLSSIKDLDNFKINDLVQLLISIYAGINLSTKA